MLEYGIDKALMQTVGCCVWSCASPLAIAEACLWFSTSLNSLLYIDQPIMKGAYFNQQRDGTLVIRKQFNCDLCIN